jgi:iron complex outermembrane recepter protein
LKTHVFLSLALLNVIPVFADSTLATNYEAGSDFFGEAPVVLTVSRMHKPLDESPASVSIIDRQMIRDSGARQIADIFRMVPGFIVGYFSGNEPVVTYQGLGNRYQRQLQVLIDGRSVFIPSYGGVPWTNLPLLLEDIERVEITRGPNAVTYGANAFLATINIITRHAAEDAGGEVIVTQGLGDESSTSDVYARYGNNYGDLDWRISAGRGKDDGYDNLHDSKILEKFNIRADYLSDYNQFWTIQAGLNQTKAGRGDGGFQDIFRDEDVSNSYQNIKWEMVGDNANTTALFTHTRQVVQDKFKSGALNEFAAILENDPINSLTILSLPPFFTDIDFGRKSDRLDFEIYQSLNLNSETKLLYGGSLRKDEVVSNFLFNDELAHTVDTKRLFSSVEWKSQNDLILDFGIMLEDTNYTDREVSHRVSLLKKIGQHSLRLVSSTAKRNPILWEQTGETQYIVPVPEPLNHDLPYLTWRANKNLDPESINATEIGLFTEYLNGQLTSDLKLFHYKIRDQINVKGLTLAVDPSNNINIEQTYGTAINDGETIVNGLDLSFNLSPEYKQYRVFGGMSIVEAKESIDDFAESYPEHTAYLGGHYNLRPYHQISGTLYFVDSMSWTGEKHPIDDYTKLDLRYQYTIEPSHDVTLELIGQNLLDDYVDYNNDRFHSRTYLLRLAGKF